MWDDLTAAKPVITKNRRTHLEIILPNEEKQQFYAAEGLTVFQQTLQGYIPVNIRRNFLSVRLRNAPMDKKEHISEKIKEAFQDIGTISSIKPLVYKGTSVLSDQWVVIFETTEDPDLPSRISRFTDIWDHKVITDWKEAPKLCFFCDKAGHVKKECPEYKASVEARNLQKSFKLARIQEKKQLLQRKAKETLVLSPENPYIKEENQEMSIETTTAESTSDSTKVDENMKIDPEISDTEITNTSSNGNQILEVSLEECIVNNSQEKMAIDPLATFYDKTETIENATQTD